MLLILEIAAGIVLGFIAITELPRILKWGFWAGAALLAIVLAGSIAFAVVFLYDQWTADKGQFMVLLAVAVTGLLGAYIYDRMNYAPLRRAIAKEKAVALEMVESQSDADFKLFLAESLERRRLRELNKNAK